MPKLCEAIDGKNDGATVLIVKPGEVLSIDWLKDNSPTDTVIIGLEKC